MQPRKTFCKTRSNADLVICPSCGATNRRSLGFIECSETRSSTDSVAGQLKALQAFAAELASAPESTTETHAAVCRCVSTLANSLRPEYAEALQRVEVDGVAVKDYAMQAGISPGAAAVRIFRAREALRKQVTHSCGSCARAGCLDCTCNSAVDASEENQEGKL